MECDRSQKAEKPPGPSAIPQRGPELAAPINATPGPQQLRRRLGNRAAGGLIQAKLRVSQAGDKYEREADRVAEQVMRMPERTRPEAAVTGKTDRPQIQRLCSECEEEEESGDGVDGLAQRQTVAASEPSTDRQAESENPVAGGGHARLIVEDDSERVGPGQMRKSEFLGRLRVAVCSEAEQAMTGTGQTTEGCPYIDRWFGHYQHKDSRYIERSLHRYAPEAAGVSSAGEYIPLVASRVRRSVEVWASTGEVTGVPEEIAGQVMGEGILGAIGGALSGVASAAASVVSGIGGLASGIGRLLFKARDGGARLPGNGQASQVRTDSGRGLDGDVRQRMESAFGEDFSAVHVHTDTGAAHAAAAMNARAFTVGKEIAFGSGEYQPGTLIGDALIAHELAHVVQQSGAGASPTMMPKADGQSDALEGDADLSAVRAVTNIWGGARDGLKSISDSAMPSLRSGLRLQRCPREARVSRPTDARASRPSAPRANQPTGACVTPFTGVTFTLSNQIGRSEPNAMDPQTARFRGGFAVGLVGIRPAHYTPDVTIHAPDDATAQNFEAGLIQNVLTSDRRFTYTGGALIRDVISPLPIRDGARSSSPSFDPVFASTGPGVLGGFDANSSTVFLDLRDRPQDGAAVNRADDFDPSRRGPTCPAGTPAATLERLRLHDTFRTWVGIRHKPSACIVTQHHIDWETNWEVTVSVPAGGGEPTLNVVSASNDVTQANGDGSPTFVRGQVGGEVLHKECG
jgi:hypothetical protein